MSNRIQDSDPLSVSIPAWVARDAISFSAEDPGSLGTAVERIIESADANITVLGLGESFHGGEEILRLRNRVFQYLVMRHGFTAIAIESSFPRSRIVNTYVSGGGPDSYGAVQDAGFSHGFGHYSANRELVEWMREYNADPSHPVQLRFYGFDSPTEMMVTDSPRPLLRFVLEYLISVDSKAGLAYRDRMEPLIGEDSRWENPDANMNPGKATGLSPSAAALRIETEELIADLSVRRPELVLKTGEEPFFEALQYAVLARQLLTYHAGVARDSEDRVEKLLGLREVMMADILEFIIRREERRGKVMVFAHNYHLQYGISAWQLGPHACTWWPAGAHLKVKAGSRYAVIGSGVGVSDALGIGMPEDGTLEDFLTSVPGPARVIPTHHGSHLSETEVAGLQARSGSAKNSTYFPFTPRSLTDFDWLLVLD